MSSFVDSAQLHARAGDGGAGCVSFRREAHVAKGGPDGGDGGRGGDVWVVSDPNQASLLGFRDHPFRRAGDGTHGTSKRQHGSRGKDLTVAVPVGTVVLNADGEVLMDFEQAGVRWRAAEGGLGGSGNARFLSNKRRAPAFAEQGERGEEQWLTLELKLQADVALIGYPNVGKSTLISRVSAARPKIADYPFTTLVPNLGVVRVGDRAAKRDDATEFVLADIPGLIEGAADGRGLGHNFLKHVERARVLCVLLDLAASAPSSADEQLIVLLRELGQYDASLLERPRIVVGSRADLAEGDGGPPLQISSVTGNGLDDLVREMARLVDEVRRADLVESSDEVVIHRPVGEGVTIERTGDHDWAVHGRAALRATRFSDLTDEEALAEVVARLKSLGVDRLLSRAGVREGDVVSVGGLAFEWWRDQMGGGLDAEGHHRVSATERKARRRREPDE